MSGRISSFLGCCNLLQESLFQMESNSLNTIMGMWSWKEVLERLLNIIVEPVVQGLTGVKTSSLPGLTRHCCHLLARVVAELVHQCNASEVSILAFFVFLIKQNNIFNALLKKQSPA